MSVFVLLCLLLLLLSLLVRVPHDAGFPAGLSCVGGKTVNRFFRKLFFLVLSTLPRFVPTHSVIISYTNTHSFQLVTRRTAQLVLVREEAAAAAAAASFDTKSSPKKIKKIYFAFWLFRLKNLSFFHI